MDVAVASASLPRNIGVLTVCVCAAAIAAVVAAAVAAVVAAAAAVPTSVRFADPGRDSPAHDAGAPPPGVPSTPRCCECGWSCALAKVWVSKIFFH